jgi:hypothetical protein
MSQLKGIDLVGIDGIATLFTVLFVVFVIPLARWLWR